MMVENSKMAGDSVEESCDMNQLMVVQIHDVLAELMVWAYYGVGVELMAGTDQLTAGDSCQKPYMPVLSQVC